MTAFLRRHLTTVVLVLLAAIAVVLLVVVDKGNVTTDEREHRKTNLLPAWRLDDIRALELTAHGKTAKLTLGEPNDAGQRLWQVAIDGGQFLASQQAVDQLMGTLEYATFERRVSKDAVSEADLGLGAPVTRIAIEMGARTYKIAVGGLAPSPKDARYCEADGNVYVITAQLAAALDMQPDALRTRQFVPYLSTELKALDVDGEGGARRFARAAWTGSRGAGFRFDGSTPDGDVRANAQVIDALLGALGTLQAETFLADADADRALQKRVTLTLVPKDEAQPKAVIFVGGACPGKEGQLVAVRAEPTRTSACVPAEVMEALARPAKDFVDLSVLGARPDEVTEVSIQRGERVIEMARAGTGWHMRKPSDRKVSGDAGDAMLTAIAALSADKIVTGAPEELGLSPPQATLRVTSSSPGLAGAPEKERVETVEVGAPKGGVIHVRRAEDGAILELSAEKARALQPSEVVLRDAAVIDLPREQVRSLSVRAVTPQGPRVQKLTKGSGGWAFAEPQIAGLTADSSLVEDVTDALVTLRALRWVAEKDDGSFGLDAPRFVLEISSDEPDAGAPKKARVEIGAATTDGVFARTSDDPAVFVAPAALEEVAGKWLFDRQALVLDAAALVKVEAAAAGGKKVVAERAGDAWKSTSGDGDAAAAALRSAVTGLIAEGVVSTGAPDRSFGLDKPRLVLTIVAEPEPAQKGAARRTIRIAFGAGDSFRGTSIVYARRDGLDVTFAIAQGKVRPLFDAAGVK